MEFTLRFNISMSRLPHGMRTPLLRPNKLVILNSAVRKQVAGYVNFVRVYWWRRDFTVQWGHCVKPNVKSKIEFTLP